MNLETGTWEDMPKKIKNKIIKLKNFNKFWVYDKPYGSDIIFNTDDYKLTVQCMWRNRKRTRAGRVQSK